MGAITYILSPSPGHFKAMVRSNATGFGNLKGRALMALAGTTHRKIIKKTRSTPEQRARARIMGVGGRFTQRYGPVVGRKVFDKFRRAVDTTGDLLINPGEGNKDLSKQIADICNNKDLDVIAAELGPIDDTDSNANGLPEAGIYVMWDAATGKTWNVDFDPDPDGGSPTVTYLDEGEDEGSTEDVNAWMMALYARRASDDEASN